MNQETTPIGPNGKELDLARLDSLRSRIAPLLAEKRFTEAEPLVADVLVYLPDDILALNQLGLIYEGLGRKDAAIKSAQYVLSLDAPNSIARNRLRRLGAPPPPLFPPQPRPGGDSVPGVWTLKEAFPHVDAVLDEMTRGNHDWVFWRDVRDALLTDSSAALAIEHWAAQQGKPPWLIASMIMAHWNASITNGRNEYDDKYERRSDSNAYRRRYSR